MTTVRQSSNSTIHTTSTSHLNNSHDDNLDMLLEDLQTSVSRPGSSLGMNGPITSGYREVTRTVTNQGINGPQTSREYQIEYLNPANPTTIISERAASPNLDILTDTSDLPAGSRKMAQYKVQTYQYKTVAGSPAHEASGSGDLKMRQNINELDSLLDDLHTAQKTGFSADNSSALMKKSSAYDSSLIEPIETSTPKGGHVSRSIERKIYQEQRYGSVGRQSPAREIKQDHSYSTSTRQEPSPLRQRKEIYKYESKTTRSGGNTREFSPPSPPPIRSSSGSSPSRQMQSVRTYNYTSSSDQDGPRTPAMHRSPSPTTHRSPSPAGRTVRSYNYSSNRTHEYSTDGSSYSHPQPPYRSPSPSPKRTHTYNTTTTTNTSHDSHRGPMRSPSPGPKTTVHSYNYSSSSTKETKSEVPKTPPPHRSPSPVSFISPPVPNTKTSTVKTYNFEQSQRPQSPQPIQKFSPSDPSRTLNYQVSPPPNQTNIYSYKYSSHTTQNNKYPAEEHVPLLPRPFPTPSPTPDQQQQPPKKLDELMASFSDTEIHQQHHQYHDTSNRYTHQQTQQQAPKQQQVVVAENPSPTPPQANVEQPKSKNVTGPPVYYPPGVELFSKKEEMFTQQQAGGGKMKAKAKYEYEASSKSKQKSSSGKAVVPVCLPVCCAMPCVIM